MSYIISKKRIKFVRYIIRYIIKFNFLNDMSYTNWYAMSDKSLVETIGSFVRQNRLDKNKTQHEVASQAGISRSTLSLLEKGETVTVPTLIQVLRSLELLHVMDTFQVSTQISPLALAKLERDKRIRARSKKQDNNTDAEW